MAEIKLSKDENTISEEIKTKKPKKVKVHNEALTEFFNSCYFVLAVGFLLLISLVIGTYAMVYKIAKDASVEQPQAYEAIYENEADIFNSK